MQQNATRFTLTSGDEAARSALSLTPTQDDKCRHSTHCPKMDFAELPSAAPTAAAEGIVPHTRMLSSEYLAGRAAFPHPTKVTLETGKIWCKQESFYRGPLTASLLFSGGKWFLLPCDERVLATICESTLNRKPSGVPESDSGFPLRG